MPGDPQTIYLFEYNSENAAGQYAALDWNVAEATFCSRDMI
jgi:hypothetical protein